MIQFQSRKVTVSSLRRTPARFSLVAAVTAMAVEALHEKSVTPRADDDALRLATVLEPIGEMHTQDNSAWLNQFRWGDESSYSRWVKRRATCLPTSQCHVVVISVDNRSGELKKLWSNVYQRDLLQRSRESCCLFRIPERWRRRLQMRLAYSLASVSQHTVHFQVTLKMSNRLENCRLFISELCFLFVFTAVGHSAGKHFLTVKRVNDKSRSAVVGNGQNSVSYWNVIFLFWAYFGVKKSTFGVIFPKCETAIKKPPVMFRRMLTKSTS